MKRPLLLILSSMVVCMPLSSRAKDTAKAPAEPEYIAPSQKKFKPTGSIKQTLFIARKENKLAFIQMGDSSGCSPCQALKIAIEGGEYPLPEKHFVWTDLNINDPATSADFNKRFKVKGSGTPLVAVTDGSGKVLASSSGFISKEKFNEMIEQALFASGKKKAEKPAAPVKTEEPEEDE